MPLTATIAIIFTCLILQFFLPINREQKLWRKKESFIDLQYVALTFLASHKLFNLLLVALLIAMNAFGYGELGESQYLSGVNTYLKLFLAIAIIDFIAYWIHRFFHKSSIFWKFHAIHHSPKLLDLLSAFRFHPIDRLIIFLAQFIIAIALFGFSLETVALAKIIRSTYGYIVHSNVKLDYGWLRYLLASPIFHHWHHTMEREGMNKNFAGVFSTWDYIFGTAYYPNKKPINLGIKEDIGENVFKQLLYPFKFGK